MYRVPPVPSVKIKQRIESILLRLLSPWYLHSRNTWIHITCTNSWNCTVWQVSGVTSKLKDSTKVNTEYIHCLRHLWWWPALHSLVQISKLSSTSINTFLTGHTPRLLSFLHLDRFNDPLECVCDASGSQSAGGQKIGGTSRRDFLHVKQCPKRIYVMRQRHVTLICDD